MDIIGGHTEVTDAVNRFVMSITAIGRTINRTVIRTSGAKPDDDLVLTKYAGLEEHRSLPMITKKSWK